MTVKEVLLNELICKGMSDNQAEQVLNEHLSVIKQDTNYEIDLYANKSAYPKEVYYSLFSGLNHTALQWIEKNIPMAWFKPMFL